MKITLKLLVCFLDHTNGTKDDFGFCIQGLLLAGTKGPYVVLGIESRYVTLKQMTFPLYYLSGSSLIFCSVESNTVWFIEFLRASLHNDTYEAG